MLETFLELVTATARIGSVTEFYGCSGLITIDGTDKEGKVFHLTYRKEGNETDADP